MIVPSVTLELGGLTLVGASRAGIATHIAVPELKLGLDIGDCPLSSVPLRTILLSHAHTDHVLGLLRLLSLRDLNGLARPKVLAPVESIPAMRRWFAAWDELEARSRAPGEALIGVVPGDRHALSKGLEVEVLSARHTLPVVGYRLRRTIQTLRPDLVGKPGPEIGALARAGEAVRVPVERDVLTFFGDHGAGTLDDNAAALDAPVVIIECTYLDPTDRELAAARGHTHIDDIAERAGLFTGDHLVLKHLSMKHDPGEARRALARLPQELRARTVWLLPERNASSTPD